MSHQWNWQGLEILHSFAHSDWALKFADPGAHSLIPQRQEKKLTLFFGISAIWTVRRENRLQWLENGLTVGDKCLLSRNEIPEKWKKNRNFLVLEMEILFCCKTRRDHHQIMF